jgi:hypothetical protein
LGLCGINRRFFFNIWWKGIGKSEKDQSNLNPLIWFYTIIASAVEAIFLSLLLNIMGSGTLAGGLQAGFMIWLGFVAPTNLVNKLFANHGWSVWLIEAGHHLLTLLAMGAILVLWR